MSGYGKREVIRLLRSALRVCEDKLKVHPESRARGDIYTSGLAPEGYDGGYAEGLRDVLALLEHGYPSDQRHVLHEARERLKR